MKKILGPDSVCGCKILKNLHHILRQTSTELSIQPITRRTSLPNRTDLGVHSFSGRHSTDMAGRERPRHDSSSGHVRPWSARHSSSQLPPWTRSWPLQFLGPFLIVTNHMLSALTVDPINRIHQLRARNMGKEKGHMPPTFWTCVACHVMFVVPVSFSKIPFPGVDCQLAQFCSGSAHPQYVQ